MSRALPRHSGSFSILFFLVLSGGACIAPEGRLSSGAAGAEAPADGNNLLGNSGFDGGAYLPWSVSFTDPGKGEGRVENKAFCLQVDDPGQNRWDAQIRHRDMVIQKGHHYTVEFTAWATQAMKVRPKVGMSGPPYAEYWTDTIELLPTPQRFRGGFTMRDSDDPLAEFAFHVGGEFAPGGVYSVCIDDIYLLDPEFEREAAPVMLARPGVRVNQLGYLPTLAKLATVASDSPEPIDWQLTDASGAVLTSGKTIVSGQDAASGESLHTIDFGEYTTVGQNLVLRAGGESSHPFDIDPALYHKLKYDALAYFYHNRSGIPIELPYAGHKRWTRPAGHLSDSRVPCAQGCDYSLDVSKGWYDAGDHGKYVVNGGIALWTMLDQYERAAHLASSADDFGDGKLAIPEQGNGIPDILDEARWQLAFMLGMQVPDGQPLAGMAHHKVHDDRWTALPLAPHADKESRHLQPPSTAATLNLAAVAAQAARVYRPFDAAFAETCKKAAERAWSAAEKHPKMFAPAGGVGGGPYDDTEVSDERYWAAAELFITTGDERYHKALLASPHHKPLADALRATAAGAGAGSAMSWQVVNGLGVVSLAVVPNKLPKAERDAARAAVVAAADAFLEMAESQGYRVPLSSAKGELAWGSNSFLLNNMLVLALAYDFTKKPAYRDAVQAGMDYLLGRNPLDQSYITGYGERPLRAPHHRFWAHSIDSKFPFPPPGAVSGGPNTSLQDPTAQAAGLAGCAPMTCFLDHIEAWSLNEITINWNAPLAWVAAFLDEQR